MGKLTLHSVYEQFRSDMFLSSLTESGASYSVCRVVPRLRYHSDRTPDGYVGGQGALARPCDP